MYDVTHKPSFEEVRVRCNFLKMVSNLAQEVLIETLVIIEL